MENENTLELNMEGLDQVTVSSLASGDLVTINTTSNTVMDYNINLDVNDDIIAFDLSESANSLTDVVIDKNFVEQYFMIERLVNKLASQMDDAKAIIKRFIEEHGTGSIESNGMTVKYTPSTTSTTIDSTKLKSSYPEIAAECSKVSSRKSSISIKESN